MSESLQIIVGAAQYSVHLTGTTVYADSGLTTEVSMPADVAADTTWWIADRAQRAGPLHVRVWDAGGALVIDHNADWAPRSVYATERVVTPTPPPAAGSVAVYG